MYHKYRYGTPEITKRDIENRGIPDCFQRGFPNIYEMNKTNSRRCGYRFGEYLFISLSETVGTETVVSALRDLYILGRAENRPVNEEEIYRALLAHTPPGLEDDLQEIYDRIHGGPRADSGE